MTFYPLLWRLYNFTYSTVDKFNRAWTTDLRSRVPVTSFILFLLCWFLGWFAFDLFLNDFIFYRNFRLCYGFCDNKLVLNWFWNDLFLNDFIFYRNFRLCYGFCDMLRFLWHVTVSVTCYGPRLFLAFFTSLSLYFDAAVVLQGTATDSCRQSTFVILYVPNFSHPTIRVIVVSAVLALDSIWLQSLDYLDVNLLTGSLFSCCLHSCLLPLFFFCFLPHWLLNSRSLWLLHLFFDTSFTLGWVLQSFLVCLLDHFWVVNLLLGTTFLTV